MRILGIDLGSSSSKIIELESAFRRLEIINCHELTHDPVLKQTELVSRFVDSLGKKPDRIVMSLPTTFSTFRNFDLPTRDRKAIQAGISFELEDELPFTAEDLFFDYSLLAQSKKSSQVHVAVTLRSRLISFLAPWTQTSANPDILLSELWAMRSLLNRVLAVEKQSKPIFLIQIGFERTLFYVQHAGIPIIIREVNWGGKDLSIAICKEFQVTMDEAEQIKRDYATLLPKQDKKAKKNQSKNKEATQKTTADSQNSASEELAALVENTCFQFIQECIQTELACKAISGQPVGQVYLSGGGALLPGLDSWITKRLRVPSKHLMALSHLSPAKYSEKTEAQFALAAGLALSSLGQERTNCINLRKAELIKTSEKNSTDWRLMGVPLLSVAAVFFCFFLSMKVQTKVYESRQDSTKEQLERSLKVFFGGALTRSTIADYISNPKKLTSQLASTLTKAQDMSQLYASNPFFPLDFLKSVSAAVPKNVVVDMLEFEVGSGSKEPYGAVNPSLSAELTFSVANPQVAEKLAPILNTKLKGMNRGPISEWTPQTKTGGKRLKLAFKGVPLEANYEH